MADDGRAYLDDHGVSTALSNAVAQVLRERPANPLLVISDALAAAGTKAEVIGNYTGVSISKGVNAGIEKLGKTWDDVTIADLAPVDEFHVGGRVGTDFTLEKMGGLTTADAVLDVGCGTGGSCRYMSEKAGSVIGVDLTPDYIAAGKEFNTKLKISNVELKVGDATKLAAAGIEAESVNKVVVQHVGMNIKDKHALAASIAHAVKKGGTVAVYDFMKVGDGAVGYPMPWASAASHSFLGTPAEYKAAFAAAGLVLQEEIDRKEFCIAFVTKMMAMMKKSKEETGAPPPLSLGLYFGNMPPRIMNVKQAAESGAIAPVVMIFTKPA